MASHECEVGKGIGKERFLKIIKPIDFELVNKFEHVFWFWIGNSPDLAKHEYIEIVIFAACQISK